MPVNPGRAITACDPLQTVWDALARSDCEPRGEHYDFRAKCPLCHDDRADALHVSIGADGRCVLWCFACNAPAKEIVPPLGLDVHDLFPAGHYKARRLQLARAQRADFTGSARVAVNTLKALEELGADWRVQITTDCAYCGSMHAQLVVKRGHDPFLHCDLCCTARMFVEGLAGLVADQEEAA